MRDYKLTFTTLYIYLDNAGCRVHLWLNVGHIYPICALICILSHQPYVLRTFTTIVEQLEEAILCSEVNLYQLQEEMLPYLRESLSCM